eukprot:GABV01009601.1.p1 GENE.GABV01009601.1~~GABV01009601.1.p1  ORF type:complete len:104 (+),score=34.74 GABV01009601.1:304-615(+)
MEDENADAPMLQGRQTETHFPRRDPKHNWRGESRNRTHASGQPTKGDVAGTARVEVEAQHETMKHKKESDQSKVKSGKKKESHKMWSKPMEQQVYDLFEKASK